MPVSDNPIFINDVLAEQNHTLNFATVPQTVTLKPTDSPSLKAPQINTQAQAELNQAIETLSSSYIKQITLFLAPESAKATIYKQAVELCQKAHAKDLSQLKSEIQAANAKLLSLNPHHDQIKQIVLNIQSLLENSPKKLVDNQQKINANLAEIKALEPLLEPAFRRIEYTISTAKAIAPTLIKQPFDAKQLLIEDVVLNKSKFVNNAELFIEASKVIQETAAEFPQLQAALQEKLAIYQKVKSQHEAFKHTVPNPLTETQLQKAAELGSGLRKAIEDYHAAKAPLDKIVQAENYLKYHDNWSSLSKNDIDTATLISAKKQENAKLTLKNDEIKIKTPEIEKQISVLGEVEQKIIEQKQIVSEKQLLLEKHQSALDYFQAALQKATDLPVEHPSLDSTPEANSFLPSSLTELSAHHTDQTIL